MNKVLAIVIGAMMWASISSAAIVLNAVDSGYYSQDGLHNAFWLNYGVGQFNGPAGILEERNFFVFDLSSVNQPIVNAYIRLENPWTMWNDLGYRSPDGSETFTLFNVSTPIATLVAGGSGLVSVFDDLGSGSVYGSHVATSVDNGAGPAWPGTGYVIEFALNATLLSDLNAASGLFALGGAITTLSGTPELENLFGYTDFPGYTRQLVLETAVPDGGSAVAMLGLVTLAVAGLARRFGFSA